MTLKKLKEEARKEFDNTDFLIFRGSDGCSCEVNKEKNWKFIDSIMNRAYEDGKREGRKNGFIEGAKEMIKFIDNSMENSGAAERIYTIRTFKIRELIKFSENKKSLIYKKIK